MKCSQASANAPLFTIYAAIAGSAFACSGDRPQFPVDRDAGAGTDTSSSVNDAAERTSDAAERTSDAAERTSDTSEDTSDAAEDTSDAAEDTSDAAEETESESSCSASETVCAGAAAVKRCTTQGTWAEPVGCPFVCLYGACVGVCSPGDVTCTEDGMVATCTAQGQWEPTEVCAATCEKGTCVSVCTEGTVSCSGQALTECRDGQTQQLEACEFVCDENVGECTGECVPNESRCIEGALAICGADGSFEDPSACPFICLDGECGGECTPGETRCQSATVQETCSEHGAWEPSECDYLCTAGACGGECSPGERRCLANGAASETGSESQLCSEDGEWDMVTACVKGCEQTQCSGQCQSDEPAECLLSEGKHQRRACDDGQRVIVDCEYVCAAGSCAGACEPGARRCGSDGETQVCSSTGEWEFGTPCTGSAVCTGEGQCLNPPAIAAFTATDASVGAGDSTTLSWVLTGGAASVSITPEPDMEIAAGATTASVTPTETSEYTLTASNAAGEVTETLRVAVVAKGVVKYVRHYGSTGNELGHGIVVDGDRLVTLNHAGGPIGSNVTQGGFLAAHSITDGSPSGMVAQDDNPYRMAWDDGEFLLLGKNGPISVARVNSSFQRLAFVEYTYYTNTGEDPYSIAVAPSGDVFVAGSSDFTTDGILSRIDADLTSVATAQFGSAQYDQGYAVAVDSMNRVFAGGSALSPVADPSDGSRAGGSAFIARYAANQIVTPSTVTASDVITPQDSVQFLSESAEVAVLVVDEHDFIVAGGYDWESDQGFVRKYANDLDESVWERNISERYPLALAIDDANNVIVASESIDGDIFVEARAADNGDLIWTTQFTSDGHDDVGGIASDSRGNVFVVGNTTGAALVGGSGYPTTGYVGGGDAFLIRIQ